MYEREREGGREEGREEEVSVSVSQTWGKLKMYGLQLDFKGILGAEVHKSASCIHLHTHLHL